MRLKDTDRVTVMAAGRMGQVLEVLVWSQSGGMGGVRDPLGFVDCIPGDEEHEMAPGVEMLQEQITPLAGHQYALGELTQRLRRILHAAPCPLIQGLDPLKMAIALSEPQEPGRWGTLE